MSEMVDLSDEMLLNANDELVQLLNERAKQRGLSMDAALRKCIIAGINYNALDY